MPKLQTRKYLAPEPQILAFPDHYVNVPGKIEFDDLAKLYATIQAGEKTKMQNVYTDASKVLPRGLAVHIDGDGKVTAPVIMVRQWRLQACSVLSVARPGSWLI